LANHVDLTAIMTALGGRQAMQDVLGVGASAISNYVARGSVPTHVRSKLYNALTAAATRSGWMIYLFYAAQIRPQAR